MAKLFVKAISYFQLILLISLKIISKFELVINMKKQRLCECSREIGDHKETSKQNEHWSFENNTVSNPCNSYGFIRFTDFEFKPTDYHPKFIRFDCVENAESTCESLYKLLFETDPWNLQIPKLIISFNGSLEKFRFISNQHKKNLKQGFINVMKHDQTLVLSSGFNIGIHKLVSETIYEFRLHQEEMEDKVSLIGINTWGSIANNQKLIFQECNDAKGLQNRLYYYKSPLINEKGKHTLDGLHDNFLFCDDGTEKQYDREVEFRLKFENYLKNKTDAFLVQILFEGGRMAMEHVYTVLNDEIPIVIVKGSGGIANLIASVMELPNSKHKENISALVNENQHLFEKSKGEITEYINFLCEIYRKYKRQIVIYDMMNNNMKFDKKILEAMILGYNNSLDKTLKLCIRFKCPKIANRAVFSDSKYQKISRKTIEKMFINCLKENRPEFIELFIENNFEVEKFINDEILRDLYQISFNPDQCQCAELLSELCRSARTTYFTKKNENEIDLDILYIIGKVVQKLSGNVIKNLYEKYKFSTEKNKLILNDAEIQLNNDETSFNEDFYEENGLLSLNAQNLFLWALLSGMTEMSLVFWKINKDQIGSALLASTILRSMASLMLKRGDNNLEKKFSETSKKYQDLSVLILTEAYKKNKMKTYILLIRELKKWNNTTCLQIATNSDMLEFLNHSACRSYITKVWMGELSPILSNWKIILTIPFSFIFIKPLIIPTFPPKKIMHEESDKMDSSEMKLLEKTEEVQYSYPVKRIESEKISYREAMRVFYGATIVKFYIYLLSYVSFLLIFIYLNLVELKPLEDVKSIKDVLAEIYIYIYVFTFICEEIRQVTDQKITGLINKAKEYFSGIWNKIDVFIISLFFLSVILRFSIPKTNFMSCRCCFAVTLSMFFIRAMQFYFINQSIGPKVIMIREMLRDILFFLSIFIIFLLAYGTLFQSLKFPNSKFDLNLFKDIVYLPYFQTFGELMLEIFDFPGTCNRTECVIRNATVIFSFAIYLLMTNILLVNLLIAMFGFTFNQIQEDSEKLWCFIRVMLVQEFYEKHILPPPLNIFYFIIRLLNILLPNQFKRIFKTKNNLLFRSLSVEENQKMCGFEQFCMEAAMLEFGSQVTDIQPIQDIRMKTAPDTYDNVDAPAPSPAPEAQLDFITSFQLKLDKRLDNIERNISQHIIGQKENLI